MGTPPESRCGLLALVCEDLGIGQPGVVVDGGVQVGVAEDRFVAVVAVHAGGRGAVAFTLAAALGAPSCRARKLGLGMLPANTR